jgi:hypothetical protein
MTKQDAHITPDPSPQVMQVSRNGLFSDEQMVRAAHDAVATTHLKLVGARVNMTANDAQGTVRPSLLARRFLESLLANAPLHGPALKIESFSDDQIVNAIYDGFASGMIGLVFIDKNGTEKPTIVVDDFLRRLLPGALPYPAVSI